MNLSQLEAVKTKLHVRVTKQVSPDNFLSKYEAYVLGKETDHFHVALFTDTPRKTVVEHLKQCFSVKGNKEYSCTAIKHIKKIIQYVLKEGNTTSHNISDKIINTQQKLSFKKKGMVDDILSLDTKFYETDMGLASWIEGFLKIKCQYGQAINVGMVKSMALTRHLKKHPKQRKTFALSLALDLTQAM